MAASTRILLLAPEGADRLLAAMLSTQQMEQVLGSCAITRASQLHEGLTRLEDTPFDICLVDASLESALEFIGTARNRGWRLPILLVTGQASADLRAAAMAAGATDAVPKGNTSPHLLAQAVQGAILRGRYEDSLAKSEARFQRIFRWNPVGNTITSLQNGRFIDVNDAFCRLVGYAREEVVGRSSTELNLFADPADRAKLLELLRRDGSYQDVEVALRTREGKDLRVRVSAQTMDFGDQPCILAAIVDVTALRQVEARLQEALVTQGQGATLRSGPRANP